MAQLYTTGPAHIFVGVGTGTGGLDVAYLGTCENAPRVQLRPASKGVMNAISGTVVPHDKSFQGEEGFIGLDLTRWNQSVLNVVRGRAVPSVGPPGAYLPGDYGTLMITEGRAMRVWMTFPYAAKAAFNQAASGAMPPGYRFLYCEPIGPDDLGPLSTEARVEHLMFHAIPGYLPEDGSLNLYDFDTTGLPAIN